MSQDNKYILDRINAIQMTLLSLTNVLSNTLNTNGALNSITGNMWGTIEQLRAERLSSILKIKTHSSSNKSIKLFNDYVSTNLLNVQLIEKIRSVHFYLISPSITPVITLEHDHSTNVVFKKIVDGEELTLKLPLCKVLDECHLIDIYCSHVKKTKNSLSFELGKLLKELVQDPEQGIVDNVVLLAETGDKLKLKYDLSPYSADVIIELSPGTTYRCSASELQNVGNGTTQLPFYVYLDMVNDHEVLTDIHDHLIETYCTKFPDEG